MKNKRKFLMGMLTIIFVILAACGNSSEELSVTLDSQSQNSSTHKTNDDTLNMDSTVNASKTNNTKADTIDAEINDTNEKVDTTNNVPKKEEDLSTKNTTSMKEEYLKKLNDAKNEVEEIRKNPIDDTTFALKKVEGDIYDILDGLLNEIYGVLKGQLPSEEMEQLRNEQRDWLTYRDQTAKEASQKYKGGTIEQLEYVMVQNNLTEERCFELVEVYMK